MQKVRDLLKAVLVEDNVKDQDAYLEGRIIDCVVTMSDECITVIHGAPVPSGMEYLDNEVPYGAWVYSFNESELCHTFEYCKDVQDAYLVYKELKNKAEYTDIEVLFASSLSDDIYEVEIKVTE